MYNGGSHGRSEQPLSLYLSDLFAVFLFGILEQGCYRSRIGLMCGLSTGVDRTIDNLARKTAMRRSSPKKACSFDLSYILE